MKTSDDAIYPSKSLHFIGASRLALRAPHWRGRNGESAPARRRPCIPRCMPANGCRYITPTGDLVVTTAVLWCARFSAGALAAAGAHGLRDQVEVATAGNSCIDMRCWHQKYPTSYSQAFKWQLKSILFIPNATEGGNDVAISSRDFIRCGSLSTTRVNLFGRESRRVSDSAHPLGGTVRRWPFKWRHRQTLGRQDGLLVWTRHHREHCRRGRGCRLCLGCSSAEGYTLLLGNAGNQVVIPLPSQRPSYESARDFRTICRLASSGLAFAVHPSLPVEDLSQLVAYGKANPDKLSYGSAGID